MALKLGFYFKNKYKNCINEAEDSYWEYSKTISLTKES